MRVLLCICPIWRQMGKAKGTQQKAKPGPKGPRGRKPKYVVAHTGNLQVATLRGRASKVLVALPSGSGKGAPYDCSSCLIAVRVIMKIIEEDAEDADAGAQKRLAKWASTPTCCGLPGAPLSR